MKKKRDIYEDMTKLRDEYSSQSWEEGYITGLLHCGAITMEDYDALLEKITIDWKNK